MEDEELRIFKDKLHFLRKEIDAVIVKIKSEIEYPVSLLARAEVTLCYRSLQIAKMWLGKALEETGSLLPPEYADNADKDLKTDENDLNKLN